MSVSRSRWRVQRSPPGSLLICASMRPPTMAMKQSTSPWLSRPAACSRSTAPLSTSWRTGTAPAEGSNPGNGGALAPGGRRGEQDLRSAEDLLGVRVRLGRRLEARDRALKEQRAARRVLQREVHKRPYERPHRGAGIARQPQRIEPLEKLTVAVGEHRV